MTASNPYNTRWRWWYAAIADRMLAHPDWNGEDIARDLGKHANTISLIMNSDLFKVYFSDRQRQFRQTHDAALVNKMTKIAGQGLDLLSDILERKKDGVPVAQIVEVTVGALDRLGYSPNKPAAAVQINNTVQNTLVTPNASLSALQEAQAAMRKLEASKTVEPVSVMKRQHAANELLEDFEDALPPVGDETGTLVLDGEAVEIGSGEEVEK